MCVGGWGGVCVCVCVVVVVVVGWREGNGRRIECSYVCSCYRCSGLAWQQLVVWLLQLVVFQLLLVLLLRSSCY